MHKNYFYWVSMIALSTGLTRMCVPPVMVPVRDVHQRNVVFLQKISVVDATGRARLLDGSVEIELTDPKQHRSWDLINKRVGNASEKEIGDLFVQVKNFEACRHLLEHYVKLCLNGEYYKSGILIQNVTFTASNE